MKHRRHHLPNQSVLINQYCSEITRITELWLTCDTPDIAVNLGGYHLIRKDWSYGADGGVEAYIPNKINCHELPVENVYNFEIPWQ